MGERANVGINEICHEPVEFAPVVFLKAALYLHFRIPKQSMST